jgi:beta-glucosidase
MPFSKDFVWGTATASYQIEGAAFEDGKGLSVWDTFSRRPGAIKDGQTGDIACDHYHLYKTDVKIMKEIGLNAYRLSISWPRVMPDGEGRVNEKGLDFYDRLVDELLKNGITPYITLFHWDYPHPLYKKGGWLNPESPDWFAEYTKVVINRLSDRVTNWITQNEPHCYIDIGHNMGEHAPGLKLDFKDVLAATHNSLLAHGKSVQQIRASAKRPCKIGYSPDASGLTCPGSSAAEDIETARQETFGVKAGSLANSSWWMDPVCLGRYPEAGLKAYEPWLPDISPDDMKTICSPIDFLGCNIYFAKVVKKGGDGGPVIVENAAGFDKQGMEWPIVPESLYWGPKFYYERYKKPMIITENGMSNLDWVSVDGKVHDPQRIDFLYRYIRELKRVVDDGVDVKGYFCWSLLDNFEWAQGYSQRFGLTYVDYKTQKRTIKDSGYWYRDVIRSNGEIIK